MEKQESFVVGIDMGSVAIKAVLMDTDGVIRRRVVEPVVGSMEDALERLVRTLFDGVTGDGAANL